MYILTHVSPCGNIALFYNSAGDRVVARRENPTVFSPVDDFAPAHLVVNHGWRVVREGGVSFSEERLPSWPSHVATLRFKKPELVTDEFTGRRTTREQKIVSDDELCDW